MRYSDLITEDNDPNDPHLKFIAQTALSEDADTIWTEIRPNLTGINRTFWVSFDPNFPYFIVDPTPGSRNFPTNRCQAFNYWKPSKYPEIDDWMKKHKKILLDLLSQKIDSIDLYNHIRQSLYESLMEMANIKPERTGLNQTIYVSRRNHSADIRIKVAVEKRCKARPSLLQLGTIRYLVTDFLIKIWN